MDKIISFSLNNRMVVLVFAVLLMIGGLYTAYNTEVDVFPDLNAPTVVVMTEANGMAAEEVEQLVTFPIETAVNGSTGVRRVRSSSTMGFSVVWVEFDWDTDIYLARQIVSEKLAAIGESLPKNIGTPTIGPQSSILGEVLIVGLTADSTSMLDLRTLADWTVRPRLLSTGGVAQVSVLGGEIKEFQILFDPGKMRHYGVSLQELLAVTRGMNRNINGGVIYEYGNEYIVRGVVSTDDVEKLSRSVVKMTDDAPVTLADIAEVRIGAQEPKLGVASEKGKPAVLLTVTKQPNTGTIELTENLETALAEVQKNLPDDVKVSTDIFRQSRFIESSIDNVKTSLLEGSLFVVIVLALFLANARTTVISLVTIPLSLLVSVLVLYALGQSLNTMSLGGMAIAIGSLVDDAIVDVENVWRRLRHTPQPDDGNPESSLRCRLNVIFEASKEVRMPILNSTLIIVVSFMPLFFLSGMEGRMLIPLGIAFIVSLFASTVVALTLTPVLCSYLLKARNTPDAGNDRQESRLVTWLKMRYERMLLWVLNNKRPVIGGTLATCVVAIVVFVSLGNSFLPPFNEGSFTINISSLPGISLEESDKIGRQAEKLLLSVPEIKTVARKTGRAELDEHALGVNVSEIEAPFELDGRTHQEVLNDVRKKLSVIVGANIEIGQPISHRIDAMLSGTQANIAIKLFGDNLNRMFTIGNQIKESVEGVEGIADLNVEQQIERPELKIIPNRELLLRQGISLPEFNEFISVNMGGEAVAEVNEGGRSFNLVVRADEKNRSTMESIRSLIIDTPDGRKIPITDVAEIVSSMGPNTINRENVKRKIVISANTNGRDLRSVVNDIRERIDEDITLPEGYHIEYGGQFESEQAANRTLFFCSIVSIIVIFLLLNAQFRNMKESAAILLNLPLALIGGVFALLLTTGEISIPAIIGFISLFGIATRNGMLLITQYNTLRKEQGCSLRDSILRGSLDRMNPILMTALTSALALIPLALRGDLPGNEIQSPMAKVILGGLLTSTFLNAFIIPVVYEWLHGESEKIRVRNEESKVAKGNSYGSLLTVLFLFLVHALPAGAQNIDDVLQTVEDNNLQLKALREAIGARVAERRAENVIGATSVEYSPFYRSGIQGLESSELIVSQEFDFPTLYSARNKVTERQRSVMELQYQTLRRDILLQARKLCIDLQYANETELLLQRRMDNADSLLCIFDKRLQHGEATILDVNRFKMERMALVTEMAQSRSARQCILLELQQMSDGALQVEDVKLPSVHGADSSSFEQPPLKYSPLEVSVANASLAAAEEEARMAKQGWLPKLTVGYRRNTEMHEASNGFLVGLSVSLFGNQSRVKATRSRAEAARLQAQDARMVAEQRYRSWIAEAEQLQTALKSYDTSLMHETLSLLSRALLAGEISVAQYCTEAETVYATMQERLTLACKYHKLLADIRQRM